MLSLFSDIKNIIITILLCALLMLSIAYFYEKETKKSVVSDLNSCKQNITLQNSQIAQWKNESNDAEKKLNAAQKVAHELRVKGDMDVNQTMLEKVSPECLQARDWMIQQALQLRDAAQQ